MNDLKKPKKVRTPKNQWQTPGQVTDINSQHITMQGVGFDAIGVSPDGTRQYMKNGQDYYFPSKPVREYPLMQKGGSYIPKAQLGSFLQPITNKDVSRFFNLFSIPQKAVTKAITGKYQTPSQAMGMKNKAGAFLTDLVLDPVNLLGAGAVKATGAYKNAYKLNPWAFKPNPEAYYRGIGKTGYDDAIESGILRTPKGSSFGDDLYLSDKFSEAEYYADNKLPWTLSDNGKVVDDLVKGKGVDITRYVAEIPKAKVNARRYYINNSQFITNDKVPLDDVRLLKQDWLRGYKKLSVPNKKQNGGEEKDWFSSIASDIKEYGGGVGLPTYNPGGPIVKVQNSKGKVKTYNTNSPQYKRLYNQGIGSWQVFDKQSNSWIPSDPSNPNAEFVSSPKTLSEVVVTGKANPYISNARKQALEQIGSFQDFRKSQEAGYPSWYRSSRLYNPDKDLADQQQAYDRLLKTRMSQNVIDAIPQKQGESRLDYMNRINSLAGKNFVSNARGYGLTEPFDPSNIDLMRQWGRKGLNHIAAASEVAGNPYLASSAIQKGIIRGNQPVSGLTAQEASNVGILQPFETIDDVAYDYGFKPLFAAGDNLVAPGGKNTRASAQRYAGPSETDRVFTSIMNPLNYLGPSEVLAGGRNLLRGANALGKGVNEISKLSAPYVNRFIQQPGQLLGKFTSSSKIKPLQGGYTSVSNSQDYLKGIETVDPETGVSKIVYELDPNLPPPPPEHFNLAEFDNTAAYDQSVADFFKPPSTLDVLKHKIKKAGTKIKEKYFPDNHSDFSKPLTDLDSYKHWSVNHLHPDIQYIATPQELKTLHKDAIKYFGGRRAVKNINKPERAIGLYVRERLADRIPSFTDPMVIDEATGFVKNYGAKAHPSLIPGSNYTKAYAPMTYTDLGYMNATEANRNIQYIPVHKWNYDISKLTPQEVNLLDAYARGYDDNFNSIARGIDNHAVKATGAFYKNRISQLTDAIKKNKFPESTAVRRGVGSDYSVQLLDAKTFKPTGVAKKRSELAAGDVFKDDGFLSTSINQNYTWGDERFSELIDIPAGKQSYAFPNASSSSPYFNELEALLPPGLIRRVEEVRELDAGRYPNNAKYRTSILNPYTVTLPILGGAAALNQRRNGGAIISPRGQMVYQIPMMQKGGRRPIYTENPKDPRIKAYKDSLRLYNTEAAYLKQFRDSYTPAQKEAFYKAQAANYNLSTIGRKDRIDAIGSYASVGRLSPDGDPDYVHFYKKPVQPVVYRKPEPARQNKSYGLMMSIRQIPQQVSAQQQAPLRQYTGSPVYSPGAGSGMPSALVGFRSQAGDTTFIQPEDYERFAVPAYGKQYIESQTKQFGDGGQHGGLDRWFAEKWVDVKTGKECGRQDGEKRKGYPACRPSKRVSSETPKTSSEMSSAEKAKFKRSKTSSERINYNHKRN